MADCAHDAGVAVIRLPVVILCFALAAIACWWVLAHQLCSGWLAVGLFVAPFWVAYRFMSE